MKYTLLINQKAIAEMNQTLPINHRLNAKDAIILTWMMDFHAEPKALKFIKDDVVYFWASYSLIINENPLLEITDKTVIRKHIDKLITVGFLDKEVVKDQNSKTFFSIKQKTFDILKGFTDVEEKGVLKSTDRVCSKAQTGCVEKHNNNTINNNTINKESALAFDFLKLNDQIMYERLMMEFNKVPNFKKLVELFNCKFDEEQKPYIPKVIYSRFRRFALNFVANEQKNQPEENKPYVYLRKIS